MESDGIQNFVDSSAKRVRRRDAQNFGVETHVPRVARCQQLRQSLRRQMINDGGQIAWSAPLVHRGERQRFLQIFVVVDGGSLLFGPA
jgi:hypothetical protein